ncbi:MAG: GAF domain-containing SpoIIE family protein phosphatase [Leptolyngbyaceae bacterium]|nr:GAF domain-containing SpoIIE family protein phosphatase [Leptolyngbyaceae bacterium]
MTSPPISQYSSDYPDEFGDPRSPEPTPVYALKELVARLYREQNKIHDLLSSLSFALRSLKNLNQFLELTPLIASRVTDAEGGALILVKADGQLRLERLHCQLSKGCSLVRQSMELAARQVTEHGHAGTNESPMSTVMRHLDNAIKQQLEPDTRVFGTTILVKNVERGWLYVFSQNDGYHWTETRQKLIRLVADQTAVAIENDELAAELREKERLDRELEIGAEIQVQLLPRHCPKIDGVALAARCKTANRVGGDYYDFIPANYDQTRWRNTLQGTNPPPAEAIEQSRWSISIGDVMGKGVPAGLIMTMLRGMLRAEVLNRHSPSMILQHLNHVMYGDLENSNRFVTLFYSEYNPATRTLAYSNAAHHPPLLWRAATKTITTLDTAGMLIGLEMDTQYEDGEVQLLPGDTVIYYTDGFTDAANSKGHRFDEENLIQCVHDACLNGYNPQEILEYLFEKVQAFIGLAHHNEDDMTLVVLQVQND